MSIRVSSPDFCKPLSSWVGQVRELQRHGLHGLELVDNDIDRVTMLCDLCAQGPARACMELIRSTGEAH
jgi:hypothetical protein